MIRLIPILALGLLAACGQRELPERRNDRVAVTNTGVGITVTGTAKIGVSGSYD